MLAALRQFEHARICSPSAKPVFAGDCGAGTASVPTLDGARAHRQVINPIKAIKSKLPDDGGQ
jgi:hypothetical protein